MRVIGPLWLSAVVAVIAVTAAPAVEVGCKDLPARLDAAVASRSLADVRGLESRASTDIGCYDLKSMVRARRARLEIDLADDPGGPLRTDAEREAALTDAADHSDLWLADERLGDLLAKGKRWREAASRYDGSVTKANRFAHLTDDEKARLVREASAAKMLASDDRGGTRAASLSASRMAGDGKLGGIYSPSLRGARPVPVPVPIQFATDSSELTPTGRQAVDELLRALSEQGATKLDLVGHTDPRGSDDYNMRLSARRLETVRTYVSAKSPDLHVTMLPKGRSEPFDVGVLPFVPSQEETWALDRRVEWVR